MTAYYGAQVTVASFAVNFLVDQKVGIDQSKASQLLSFCQITFTISRFIGVAILNFIDPALLLAVYGFCCSLFCLLVSQLPGYRAVGCLFCLFFFESICYPVRPFSYQAIIHSSSSVKRQCIFSLGTKNLRVQTKRGTGLIVMGVVGGAWYPLAQGALADRAYTRRSYLVPMSGFFAVTIYAIGIVVDQTRKNGFAFRNRDGLSAMHAADCCPTDSLPDDAKVHSNSEKRVSSDKLIAVA